MQTIPHILKQIHAFKPCSTAQLYRYFLTLKIKPAVRQRPQLYPDGTGDRILDHLGIPAKGRVRQLTDHDFAMAKLVTFSPKIVAGGKLLTSAQVRRISGKARAAK